MTRHSTRPLIALATIMLTSAGCAPMSRPGEGSPRSPEPAAGRCEASWTSGEPCAMVGDRAVCTAWVGGSPDKPMVLPYTLEVPKQARTATIVWIVREKGWHFRDKNDGPLGLPASAAIEGGPASDFAGATRAAGRQQQYSVTFDVPSGNFRWPYTIQFAVDSSSARPLVVRCDPSIGKSGN